MMSSEIVGGPDRGRFLNAVALQNAVLCAECEVVSDSPQDMCRPVVLDGKITEERPGRALRGPGYKVVQLESTSSLAKAIPPSTAWSSEEL